MILDALPTMGDTDKAFCGSSEVRDLPLDVWKRPGTLRKSGPGGREVKTARLRAFTLVELLVVIAVIGIVATLLLPVLGAAKSKAWTTYCLNNKRQLTLAWKMYADDFRGELMLNPGPVRRQTYPYGGIFWAIGYMSWSAADPDNTNLTWLMDPQYSSMASYVKSKELYKCPADKYVSVEQQKKDWTRVRSISMNAFVGSHFELDDDPLMGGDYVVYVKEGDFRGSSPAHVWVFVDEHPDSIFRLAFHLAPLRGSAFPLWFQLPASYHNRGCTLGFADGHAEVKRWLVPSTSPGVKFKGRGVGDITVLERDLRDYVWLFERSTEPQP